nr:uncharacterized protein LOC109157018 [Ipomoea batatas]
MTINGGNSTRSLEDEDLLERSIKKTKIMGCSMIEEQQAEEAMAESGTNLERKETKTGVCSGNGRGETGCRILDNCKRKIGGGEEKRLVHVFREQNAVADWLAQRAVVGFEERIDHKKPPLGCIKLVQNDRIGGVVVRSLHEEE